VTEPFAGLTRFGGQVRVLGPTRALYEELLAERLAAVRAGTSPGPSRAAAVPLLTKAAALLERAAAVLPFETLGEDGETGPRNASSVVTLLSTTGQRLLFTGDAGIGALTAACDQYEQHVGGLPDTAIDFFQAPHHGSKRNLSPSLLDRMFRAPAEDNAGGVSFISSAKQDPKHPSPKVTNALSRRGVRTYATEGTNIWQQKGAPARADYGPISPIGPLEEDDD
jgi:hypothetical protein